MDSMHSIACCPFLYFQLGEGIGLCGDLLVRVFDVGVDLRRVQVFVSQNFLQRFQIDAVGQHQCCRRVAELVRGKLRRVQSGFQQVLLDQPVDRGDADAVFVPGAEQRLIVREDDVVPSSR